MNMRKPYVLLPFIGILLLLNGWLIRLIVLPPEEMLEVHFLDIGQGDAILIEVPGGIDLLIDGGPDRSVMRQLPKKIGIFDRKIDVVIATHPDKDHIAGLPPVFDKYQVTHFMESGVEHDSQYVEALEEAVEREPSLPAVTARRGMRIKLGEEAYADVFFPDRDVSNIETNDGSIILRLVYGNTSFMLGGDAPSKIEDYVVLLGGNSLRSDVLKASHHGSKTSTSDIWLQAVDPSIVVVSAGRGNSYGHPAPDVVKRILDSGALIFSTIEEGTVTVISDGEEVWVK